MTVDSPSQANAGTNAKVNLSFSGLAPDTRYMGTIGYSGTSGLPDPTVVMVSTAP
jgi:hypothetical protein